MSRIIVIGSANVDFVSAVEHIPALGETVRGGDLVTNFGGKGANQAVAAARLGSKVQFIASLGSDAFGDQYRRHLRNENIEVSGISRSARPNGCALIAVDAHGNNIIVVAPGANQDLLPANLNCLSGQIHPGDIVVLQFEIPMETNIRAAEMTQAAGGRVLLNASPAEKCDALFLAGVDVLILNEHEAEFYGGAATEGLLQQVKEAVVITRGDQPAQVITESGVLEIASFIVQPVDTVGAGDTFTGALAVALSEARPWPESIRFAHAAAALSTLGFGAQAAMPPRAQVDAMQADAVS